jgi:outer membrane protein
MMKKNFIFTLLTVMATFSAGHAVNMPFGIVNFNTCVADSKVGKQEQGSFEALKKQMATLLEDTEKQLNDINAKFADPEYLDGLSPDAETELKIKFQTLNEELNRYQNQYYQVLNQANMRILQVLGTYINSASENVAKEKKLALVVNQEACFFYNPTLDITTAIITEMDKQFDGEHKKDMKPATLPVAAPAPTP